MAQLAIKGHPTRGREVIQLLEMLGADRLGYKDTFVGFYYYIECDVIVSSDKCPIDAIVFTLEEFEEKFPYKVGNKVWLHYENLTIRTIETITCMRWCNKCNCILYDVSTYCNLRESAFTLYKEETMREIKSIDLNKLEQQLDEALAKETPESLNKWLDEETKALEKLVKPKFKVGDIITKRDSIENSWVVSSVSSEYYGLQLPQGSEGIGTLPIIEQDKYELIPNKFDIVLRL